MSTVPAFFLGANSPAGFYSLYSELISPARARRIYLIKGGPGCGKSTLMRQVEQRALQAGLSAQRILCSGDPDSLDALLLPEVNIALADATAPHVLEPKFPGVVEQYVDLGSCYDPEGLQAVREEIMSCMTGYPACYRRAYRCLEAAFELSEDVRVTLLTPQLRQRLARRARGILHRELRPKKNGEKGQVTRRFLSAVTHQGYLTRFDTALALCPRLYVLEDRCALGHDLLMELLTGAVEGGYDVISCPDPMAPERLQHLLIPEVGLGFVTSTPACPFEGEHIRRIRPDAAPADRECRPQLRFALKVSAALLDEAVASLAQAKGMHDELEGLYNPYVDFGRVKEIGDQIVGEIFQLCNIK